MRVALLRGINVGGHNVTGPVLCDVLGGLGLRDTRAFLASGNLLFEDPETCGGAEPGRADPEEVAELEGRIADALEARLGWAVPTFVRSPAELAAVVAHRCAAELAASAGETLQVGFWHRPPGTEARDRVDALATTTDEIRVVGRELYWLSRGPVHRSKVTGARLERAVGSPVTCRSMTTLHRLLALAEQ